MVVIAFLIYFLRKNNSYDIIDAMKSHTVKSTAKLLTQARKAKGLTQKQLADLLGLPQSYVARIEAGKTDLRTSKLMEIARLLDLQVAFLTREQSTRVAWSLADDQEMYRRQINKAFYEPDEDGVEEEVH